MNIFKTYLLNSSFHGVPYIADNRFHWTERLFWAICVILCWWASVYIMISYYYQFLNGAISFTVDTSYLEWKSNFPAVVFCEKGNNKYRYYLNEWFGADRDFDMDDILKDIVFFKGILDGGSYKCKSENISDTNACRKGNYTMYSSLIRSKCSELFCSCSWNDKKFPCCNHILPIDTVYGVCYGINSLASTGYRPSDLSMTIQNKIKLSRGQFSVELLNPDIKIFVLSKEEVPFYTEGSALVFDGISTSSHYKEENKIYLAVEEMVNEKEVKSTSIKRRGCIFPEENYLKTANVYSYSACMVECLTHIQMNMCNCTHHLMPKAKNVCNMDGLICLSLNFDKMMRNTDTCQCESSCTEMNIKVIGSISTQNFSEFENEESITKLNFMLRAPTVRYIRKVVNGYLDLIVSFGGTAGLCVGASLLTAFEIVYYFFIRPICDAEKRKSELKQKPHGHSIKNRKTKKPPYPYVN